MAENTPNALINSNVTPAYHRALPGETVVYLITTENLSGTVQTQAIEVRGLPTSWYRIDFEQSGAFPGERRTGTLTVSVPDPETSGERAFSVVVTADSFEIQVACQLDVGIREQTSLEQIGVDSQAPIANPVLPPRLVLNPAGSLQFARTQRSLTAQLTIENTSRLIEHYEIRFEGVPESWIRASIVDVRLEPRAHADVTISVSPRTDARYPAGNHSLVIVVSPHSFPDASARLEVPISIEGTESFAATLTPLQFSGSVGRFSLSLQNTGDMTLGFKVEAADTLGGCDFRFDSGLTLAVGESRSIPIRVAARRSSLIGNPKNFPFQLRVQPLATSPLAAQSVNGQFVHRPFLAVAPSMIIALLFLTAGILGGWFLLRPSEPIVGAVPTPPVGGNSNSSQSVTPPTRITPTPTPTPVPELSFTKRAEGNWKLRSWTEAGGPITLGLKVEAGSMRISSTGDADWQLDIDQVNQNRSPQPSIKCGGRLSLSKVIDPQPGGERNGEINWPTSLHSIDRSSTGEGFIWRAMCGWTTIGGRHPFTVLLEGDTTKAATLMEMKNQFGTFVWTR